jgi:hypothetical protein
MSTLRPLACLPVLIALAACATAPAPVVIPPAPVVSPPAPLTLPPALALAPGEAAIATLSARGVQVYECRTGAAGAAWAFIAPEAGLFETDGRPAGQHGAGPTWQAPDGSRLEAKVAARADAPLPGAIPWLLLDARSTGPAGRFDRVTRIRRVHTSGGAAPAAGCDAQAVGRQARVPYTADYLFHATR